MEEIALDSSDGKSDGGSEGITDWPLGTDVTDDGVVESTANGLPDTMVLQMVLRKGVLMSLLSLMI